MQRLTTTLTLTATLATTLLLATPARGRVPTPAPSDAELMHQALWSCKGLSKRRRKQVDLGLFRALLDLEREAGVPEQLRGMTLAKACIESGYTTDAKGDCGYGSCKALGIIQLWPWTQRFGVDRSDPVESVRFLLDRVNIGVGKLKGRCPRVKGEINTFVLAWLRINRGPIQGSHQRCAGTPHGLRRLRQWHRNIRSDRRAHARAERLAARRAVRVARRAARAARRASHHTNHRGALQGRDSGLEATSRGSRGHRREAGVASNWGYNASSALWSTRPVRRNYVW